MQRSPRSASLFLRCGIAVALVFTSFLTACDKGSRDSGATGASPPASAASR